MARRFGSSRLFGAIDGLGGTITNKSIRPLTLNCGEGFAGTLHAVIAYTHPVRSTAPGEVLIGVSSRELPEASNIVVFGFERPTLSTLAACITLTQARIEVSPAFKIIPQESSEARIRFLPRQGSTTGFEAQPEALQRTLFMSIMRECGVENPCITAFEQRQQSPADTTI